MNYLDILAVLPDSEENAISMKEIALAMGMEVSTYTSLNRARRNLARFLRRLIKWGWVACDRRQTLDGKKWWFNAYWKTMSG